MSLARDVSIVLTDHDGRIGSLELVTGEHKEQLAAVDGRFDEVNGYLAMLDRKEQRIIESIDQLRVVVAAQFRELREAMRVGQNGAR